MKTIDKLAEQFKREGHGDEAWALENVDRLMREYAYTKDPLTKDAEQLGADLRDLVAEWKSVTELPPPQGEQPVTQQKENRCDGCIHINEEETGCYKASGKYCANWQPAAPVAAPNCNLCKPPIDKENCAACNGIPAPVAPDEFNCHDCARVSDCGHFGYPENEKCFVQPAAPVAPAVISILECNVCGAKEQAPFDEGDECICGGVFKTKFEKQIGFEMHEGTGNPIDYRRIGNGASVPCVPYPSCEKLRVENEQLKKESNMKINCSEEVCQARFKALVEECERLKTDNSIRKDLIPPCPSCEKLRAENARLKDILDNLNIQAVRDVAKGWVSIPEVEWDAVKWEEILIP